MKKRLFQFFSVGLTIAVACSSMMLPVLANTSKETGSGEDYSIPIYDDPNAGIKLPEGTIFKPNKSLSDIQKGVYTTQDIKNKSSNNIPANVLVHVADYVTNRQYDELLTLLGGDLSSEIEKAEEMQKGHSGIYGYKTLELIKLKEIQLTDVNISVSNWIQELSEEYTDIHLYYTKFNCSVYKEDKFAVSGINYYTCAVGKDEKNQTYKLIMLTLPDIKRYSENARFYEEDEIVKMYIDKQRDYGNIIDSEGRTMETIGDPSSIPTKATKNLDNLKSYESVKEYVNKNLDQAKQFIMSDYRLDEKPLFKVNAETGQHPTNIRVLIDDKTYTTPRGTFTKGNVYAVGFMGEYVPRVTAHEWPIYQDDQNKWQSMPLEALRGGALTVKGYGWYHVHYPRNINFDVRNTTMDQVYRPDVSVSARITSVCDSIRTLAVVDGYYEIAETCYRTGTAYNGEPFMADGKYMVSQRGSAYLANHGYQNGFDILAFYYNRRNACLANPIHPYYY